MKKLATLGLFSLLSALAFACGDDDDDNNNTPSGGSGGTGGSGTAGTDVGGSDSGGSGMGGGSMAGGGMGGSEPMSTATCTGCVELQAPVSGGNSADNLADTAIFQFGYAAPGIDLSDSTVTWRVMALENNDNLFLNLFAQNGADGNYAGVYPTYTVLSAANFPPGEWVDVTLDLSVYAAVAAAAAPVDADAGVAADAGTPAVVDAGATATTADAGAEQTDAAVLIDAGGFDKATVEALGIQLGSTAALTGDATAMLAVDSVTFTGTSQANVTFATNAEGLAANTYQLPPGTPEPFSLPE